jgi:hypothetical protein
MQGHVAALEMYPEELSRLLRARAPANYHFLSPLQKLVVIDVAG